MACHCHNNFLLEMKSYYLDISYSKVPWALSRAAPPCRIPPRQNIYSFLSLSPSSYKVNNNNILFVNIQLYPIISHGDRIYTRSYPCHKALAKLIATIYFVYIQLYTTISHRDKMYTRSHTLK